MAGAAAGTGRDTEVIRAHHSSSRSSQTLKQTNSLGPRVAFWLSENRRAQVIQERSLEEETWRQVRISEVRKAGGAVGKRDRLRGM